LFFTPVAAPAALQAPTPAAPLDMTQARWPDAMMMRIEQIRDVQNAADTRIRLHPDALGHIDVAVRREGEAVHVHFAAAEPATRTLLAEAQPRLQELAEAKGLKLAQSQVDSGAGHSGERRQPAAQQPATPPRPASARDAAAADPTDTRLA
jgi:flagellar hook-length control protein FliK